MLCAVALGEFSSPSLFLSNSTSSQHPSPNQCPTTPKPHQPGSEEPRRSWKGEVGSDLGSQENPIREFLLIIFAMFCVPQITS